MLFKILLDILGKNSGAILIPFAGPNHNRTPDKINIFNSKTKALNEPQTGPIEHPNNQLMLRLAHTLNNEIDFSLSEHNWIPSRSPGPHGFAEIAKIDLQRMFVEKNQ